MGSIKIRFGCLCSTSKDDSAAPAEQARSGSGGKIREVGVVAADVRELKEATARFSPSRLIGRGENAEVFMVALRGGRHDAAAKRLIRTPPAATATATAGAGIRRKQVAVASRLQHENVVRLLGYNFTADHPVLLYELAGNSTLHDALHGPRWVQEKAAGIRLPMWVRGLRWEERVRIAVDAATGLAYLHEAGLVHHNVRSTKVLLFGGLRAKISDHGGFKEVAPPAVDEDFPIRRRIRRV